MMIKPKRKYFFFNLLLKIDAKNLKCRNIENMMKKLIIEFYCSKYIEIKYIINQFIYSKFMRRKTENEIKIMK